MKWEIKPGDIGAIGKLAERMAAAVECDSGRWSPDEDGEIRQGWIEDNLDV